MRSSLTGLFQAILRDSAKWVPINSLLFGNGIELQIFEGGNRIWCLQLPNLVRVRLEEHFEHLFIRISSLEMERDLTGHNIINLESISSPFEQFVYSHREEIVRGYQAQKRLADIAGVDE